VLPPYVLWYSASSPADTHPSPSAGIGLDDASSSILKGLGVLGSDLKITVGCIALAQIEGLGPTQGCRMGLGGLPDG